MKILIFFLILYIPIFAYESKGSHLNCDTRQIVCSHLL